MHSAPYDSNYITHCFYVDKKLFELFRIETEMPPFVYVIILFRTVQGYLEMIHFYTTVLIKGSKRKVLCNELTRGIHTVEQGQK